MIPDCLAFLRCFFPRAILTQGLFESSFSVSPFPVTRHLGCAESALLEGDLSDNQSFVKKECWNSHTVRIEITLEGCIDVLEVSWSEDSVTPCAKES